MSHVVLSVVGWLGPGPAPPFKGGPETCYHNKLLYVQDRIVSVET